MKFIYIILFMVCSLGCNTALDPTLDSCNFGTDQQYCADEDTIMECMGCRDHNSSYHCWKETGCYEPFKCRYQYTNNEKKETFASCIAPTDDRFEESFVQDPLP